MPQTARVKQRASGCLFGLALGDALGAKTEFLSVSQILQCFPPDGPQEPTGQPALVTDDTQMALAVGEALVLAQRPYSPTTLEPVLRQAFIAWSQSPENNRAPGMTCMTACERLARGLPWYQATVAHSKGCGANMRVAAVGLLAEGKGGITATTRAALAQFQAALTHGHPTALAAADLTAATIADLAAGGDLLGLTERLRLYAQSQRTVYHQDWLGPLWQQVGVSTPATFIARGWDECLTVLDRLDGALERMDRMSDPCQATGAGWIAEEAFATGLLCFLLFAHDPVAAVRRAATTSGDSDSIACLTGAFAGSHLGLAAWPANWIENIEHRERLSRLASRLDA